MHNLKTLLENINNLIEGDATEKALDRAHNAIQQTPINQSEVDLNDEIDFNIDNDPSLTNMPLNQGYDEMEDTDNIGNDFIDENHSNYESEVLRNMNKNDLADLLDETLIRQNEVDPDQVPSIISKVKGYLAEPNMRAENSLTAYLNDLISKL